MTRSIIETNRAHRRMLFVLVAVCSFAIIFFCVIQAGRQTSVHTYPFFFAHLIKPLQPRIEQDFSTLALVK